MDLNGIREVLGRRPFESFTIRLDDGRELPVPHPEFVVIGPRRIIVAAEDNSWSVVEPIMIVSLDYKGNGSFPENKSKDANTD